MSRKKRRVSGTIDRLPEELRGTVNQMLLVHSSYREIAQYLGEHGVELSQMAVCRYAARYLTTVEELRMSQENMRLIMEEIDKYPGLDVSEAILRVAGQNIFTALTSVSEESWGSINPQKLIKEASGLVRAAGYKRRIDQQVRTDTETAIEASQALLSEVMKKNHPELYAQVLEVLQGEKKKLQEAL